MFSRKNGVSNMMKHKMKDGIFVLEIAKDKDEKYCAWAHCLRKQHFGMNNKSEAYEFALLHFLENLAVELNKVFYEEKKLPKEKMQILKKQYAKKEQRKKQEVKS